MQVQNQAINPQMNVQPAQSQTRQPQQPQLQQTFASEIPVPSSEHSCYESMTSCLGACFGCLGSIPCLCCFQSPFYTVEQGTVGLITRFGKYYKSVDPGLYRLNLYTERMIKVNIKIQIADIPRQYIMTKDNVGVHIDSVLYYHVIDPYVTTFLVENVHKALIERTQTTLRQIMGMRSLQDSIENRETIQHEIQGIIAAPAQSWGVKIESILIKDLQFSAELVETLSAAAKSKRLGESKIIQAQAEVESAKLMREASDILNTPAAMQIRYLETLSSMAKNAGTKVIFMSATPDSSNTQAMNNATITEQVGGDA